MASRAMRLNPGPLAVMNPTHLVLTGLTALLLLGCVGSPQAQLTPLELSEILDVRAWRIPEPPRNHEWSIDMVTTLPSPRGSAMAKGPALLALRPISDDEYDFMIKQRGTRSSGPISPCREPEGSPEICSGYSISFEDQPRCLRECSAAVLAELSPMMGKEKRWLLLTAVPQLPIVPGNGRTITPLP